MSFSGKQIEDYLTEIRKLFKKADNFVVSYEEFHQEWKLNNSTGENSSFKDIVENAEKEVEMNTIKLLRKSLHCLVFGSINTGKSAVLNALLGKRVLKSQFGPTTNSFVEIKKSENNEDYVIFPAKSNKKENISLISRVDAADVNSVEEKSRVEVYLSGQNFPLLEDNIVLVDSPGIDSKIEIDKLIKEECKKADVLIFVISCGSSFTENEKKFLEKHNTIFSRFKIIFLFNYTDQIWDRFEYFGSINMKEANDYLCNILKVKKEHNDEGIFFISALERFKIKEKETISNVGWEEREKSFEDFIKCLKTYQRESIMKRHLELKEQINSGILNMYKEIKINKTKEEKKMVQKVKTILEINEKIKEIISNRISIIFKEMYEMFFVKGRKIVKKNSNKEESIIIFKLHIFVTEMLTIMTESLKIRIKDEIQKHNFNNEDYIMKILEKLYFPFYFNFIDHTEDDEMKNLCSCFKEIIIIITYFVTNAKMIVNGSLAVGTVAADLVLVSYMANSKVASAAVATGVGVTVAMARRAWDGFTRISSYFSDGTDMKRRILKRRYKEHEEAVLLFWKKEEELMINSYEKFFNNIPKRLPSSFEDNFQDFQESVMDLKSSGETLNE